jgi:hypothetical protein
MGVEKGHNQVSHLPGGERSRPFSFTPAWSSVRTVNALLKRRQEVPSTSSPRLSHRPMDDLND